MQPPGCRRTAKDKPRLLQLQHSQVLPCPLAQWGWKYLALMNYAFILPSILLTQTHFPCSRRWQKPSPWPGERAEPPEQGQPGAEPLGTPQAATLPLSPQTDRSQNHLTFMLGTAYDFTALYQTTKSINYAGKTPEQHKRSLSWRERFLMQASTLRLPCILKISILNSTIFEHSLS